MPVPPMIINPAEQDYRNIYKLMIGAIVPRPIAFVSDRFASRIATSCGPFRDPARSISLPSPGPF